MFPRLSRPGLPRSRLLGLAGGGGGGPTEPPDAPVISLSTYGTNYITIAWTSITGADTVEVYRDELLIDEVDADDLSYTFIGLSPETEYDLTAKASNTYGDSPLSNTITRETAASGGRALLDVGDIIYEGYYTLTDGNAAYGAGLTHRYVGDQLRLIFLPFQGNFEGVQKYAPAEFTLPGSFGQEVTIVKNYSLMWAEGTYDATGTHQSIWWEEANSRLWSGSAADYPQAPIDDTQEACISTRGLPSGTVCDNHGGWWGFENINQRSLFGKIQAVPTWFQSEHDVGEYVSLSGGYASRMSQFGTGQVSGACLGPMFVFFSDPHGVYTEIDAYLEPANIPVGAYKIGADFRAGTAGEDWYPNYSARTSDRGSRATTDVVNWFDSSDSRSNPSTPPTYPTNWNPNGQWWISETGGVAPNDPYGYARWTWGDSYEGTGDWIDNDAGTQAKHGIVMVASLCKGYGYYSGSTLNYAGRCFEIHVYDPDDVAEVVAGTLAAYKLQPAHAWEINLPGLTNNGAHSGGAPINNVGGATYDPVSGKLFVIGYSVSGTQSRIYQFAVNTGA